MISPVALPQVLAAKEARVLRQRRVLDAHGWPVVSVTLVAPGPVKDTPAYRALRDLAVARVLAVAADAGWRTSAPEPWDAPTGPEALVAVDADPAALKAAMVQVEDHWAEGRLMDLDVVPPPPSRIRVGTHRSRWQPTQDEAPLEPMSRSALNLPPRRCLVCDRPARECARSASHPLPELLDAIGALVASAPLGPAGRRPDEGPADVAVWAAHLGDLARDALLTEVRHTPKPGLVDRRNNGAHTDMDLALFETSAAAIAPFLPRFVEAGATHAHLNEPLFLTRLRPLGLRCEEAMFAATGGVNTHKGAVFAFGLLLACAGRLLGRGEDPDPRTCCAEAARVARCTMPELAQPGTAPTNPEQAGPLPGASQVGPTAGQRLYASAGLTGARGEAASGYASVTQFALPAFRETLAATDDETLALNAALLELMVRAEDTNLAKDGGPAALQRVRDGARAILDAGGAPAPGAIGRLEELDDDLIAEGLSPGGCADLLAVTWFLARWPSTAQLRGEADTAR